MEFIKNQETKTKEPRTIPFKKSDMLIVSVGTDLNLSRWNIEITKKIEETQIIKKLNLLLSTIFPNLSYSFDLNRTIPTVTNTKTPKKMTKAKKL